MSGRCDVILLQLSVIRPPVQRITLMTLFLLRVAIVSVAGGCEFVSEPSRSELACWDVNAVWLLLQPTFRRNIKFMFRMEE